MSMKWMENQTALFHISFSACLIKDACSSLTEQTSLPVTSARTSELTEERITTDDEDLYQYSENDILAAFADHIYQQVKQVDLRKLASQPTIPGPVS